MSGDTTPQYVFGHSDNELKRLAMQADYWREATLELLERAGIARRMRVLDLASGAGDVALLVGKLVGPSGEVVGVDRSAEAIATATARAAAAGMAHIRFQVSDLDQGLDLAPSFDAMVGRFVLMYLPDPAATLRRLLQLVRPGGIVALLEFDMPAAHSVPPVPLVETALEWIRETFRQVHVPLDLGPQIWRIFRAAGLPKPALIVRSKAEPAPAMAGSRYLAETVRSVLPMMERLKIATRSEVDIETLAERLEAALLSQDGTLLPPAVVGAWVNVSP